MSKWRENRFFSATLETSSFGDSDASFAGSLSMAYSSTNNFFLIDNSNALAVYDLFKSNLLTWLPHNGNNINHLCLLPNNLLLSIGDDDNSNPVVKIWNLLKLDKLAKSPALARSNKILLGNRAFPVTAVAVLDNLTQLAIGLENGVVLLLRGDISKDRFARQKIIHEGSESISALGFSVDDKKNVTLFISTVSNIFTCNTTTSGKEMPVRLLDELGCDYGCAIMDGSEKNQVFIVGRNEVGFYLAFI
ncbi:hypothetical protein HK096_001954 [Nowakowskiella sp. JEL0078]|nr:hypothetical protein HK096_001954 [Nowakowskiella sp. JEL0078]